MFYKVLDIRTMADADISKILLDLIMISGVNGKRAIGVGFNVLVAK